MELRDSFADVADVDLLLPEPAYLPPPTLEIKPHTLYRYDDYRWDSFVSDCAVVKLTKGYFTFVEFEDLDKIDMLTSIWAVPDLDPSTGEIIKVRAWCRIRDVKLSLHRFLKDAREGEYVDHFNHHPLDNRSRRNLVKTSQSANAAHSRRLTGKGILRGVEPRGNRFGGQIKFQGKTYRSEETWEEREPAHQWYLAEHKKLFGYTDTEGLPRVRSYPIFPPRVDDDEDAAPF